MDNNVDARVRGHASQLDDLLADAIAHFLRGTRGVASV
jgi:hypothetical protein